MSPYRLITGKAEITTTINADDGSSFPLKPAQLADLIGIKNTTNLFKREKELGLTPAREVRNNGARLYGDDDILAIASSFSCNIQQRDQDKVIIGRTGNMAFIRKKP